MNQEVQTKKCSKCQIIKSISEFGKEKRVKSGLQAQCKKCYHENYFNNEKYRLNRKQRYWENPEQNRKNVKEWRLTHLEQSKENDKKKRLKNPEKYRLCWQKYKKNRRQNDLNFQLKENLRGRINAALHGLSKSQHTMILIGCSIDDLWLHLEKQFTNGMLRENYGKWHIDHIRPCSSFDLKDPEQQKKCFHYTNLQPLWAKDNLEKSDKIISF